MIILSIHILEAVLVVLLGIKFFKIHSLYKTSTASASISRPSIKSVYQLKKPAKPAFDVDMFSLSQLETLHHETEKPREQKLKPTARTVALADFQASTNLFLKGLPLPEVFFSPDHEEIELTDLPKPCDLESPFEGKLPRNDNKSVLNSYIDDFFNDSMSSVVDNETEIQNSIVDAQSIVEPQKDEKEDKDDDSFITVREQNAEMVRELEELKRETPVSFPYSRAS